MTYTPENLRNVGINPDGLMFFGVFPPYDPALVSRARDLRNNGTKSEAYLWKILKNKQLGYKFSRQKPILHYIADFYCHELALVVEIDGSSHNDYEACRHDNQRDREMQAIGLRIVRLADETVKQQPLAAAQYIFSSQGIPIPKEIDKLFTEGGRLWMPGYLGRSI